MQFPLVYLLDHVARSETFIHREMEVLRARHWPLELYCLRGEVHPLPYTLPLGSRHYRQPLLQALGARLKKELWRHPITAARILKRLPQSAALLDRVYSDAPSSNKPALLHAHFAGITADLVAPVAKAANLPWTCSVHAQDVFTVSAAQTHRRLRSATAITACSQQAVQTVRAAGIAPERITLIHHGLNLSLYNYDKRAREAKIFTACRLEHKKGLDTLLHACARLPQEIAWHCVIAGSGTLQRSLEYLTRQLNLQARVTFCGWCTPQAVREHIRRASVVALPSRRLASGDRDGIANVLLEGMALGTPVITTTASAAPEVITHGVHGLLVPPDDADHLSHALRQLLQTETLRHELAGNARQMMEQTFDDHKNIAHLEHFFQNASARA